MDRSGYRSGAPRSRLSPLRDGYPTARLPVRSTGFVRRLETHRCTGRLVSGLPRLQEAICARHGMQPCRTRFCTSRVSGFNHRRQLPYAA